MMSVRAIVVPPLVSAVEFLQAVGLAAALVLFEVFAVFVVEVEVAVSVVGPPLVDTVVLQR